IIPGLLSFPIQALSWVNRLSRFIRFFSARTCAGSVYVLCQVRATHRLAVYLLGFSSRIDVYMKVLPVLYFLMISGMLFSLYLRPSQWAIPQKISFSTFLKITEGLLVQR